VYSIDEPRFNVRKSIQSFNVHNLSKGLDLGRKNNISQN